MDPRAGRAAGAGARRQAPGEVRDRIEAVVSPAMGGVIIGHEMGRALGVPAMFVERPQGVFELRRGFRLDRGAQVLMVEDVVTTGLSSREAIEAVAPPAARSIAEAALVDRSGGTADLGVPFMPLIRIDVPTYDADALAARTGGDPGDQAREPRRRVTSQPTLRLGVNIDHVATIRNARGGDHPDPVRAAHHRRRGRRRRHHRPSARGPPPHHRRRHRPADGRDRPAAEPRDGGDRGNAGDRARPQPARRLHRPREARGAHHRGRPRRRRPAQSPRLLCRQARRGGHPRQPVHRADRAPGRSRACGSALRSSSSTPAATPMSRAKSARPN